VAWNTMGHFENLSTTTKMESYPFFSLGALKIIHGDVNPRHRRDE